MGCVAYKMLTGKVPFSSDPGRSLSDFCHDRAPLPIESLIAKSVSHSAIKFVQALIKPLPRDRLDVGAALSSPWIQAQNHLVDLEKPRKTLSEPYGTPRVSSEVSSISSSVIPPENEENLILEPLGSTPVDQFFAAAASGNNNAIEILRKRRVDVNIESVDGRTPLHEAAAHGQNSTLKLLLQIPGVYKDVRDNARNTPMLAAASAANFESALILLEHGANPRVMNDSGTSALHEAATYNNAVLIRTLIPQGIRVSLERGESKMTPLHCAARNGSFEAMKVLLEEFGAKTDLRDSTGSTALHHALRSHKTGSVRLSVQQKDSTELKETTSKQTPLQTAADYSKFEDVILLLRHGADPNAKDNARWGALHMAIKYLHIDIARQLLESGADIGLHGGPNSLTPLQLAIKRGSKGFIELLSDRGAKFDIWNGKGTRIIKRYTLMKARWEHFLALRSFLMQLTKLVEFGDHLISNCREMDRSGNLTQFVELLQFFMTILRAWSFDMHKIKLLDLEKSSFFADISTMRRNQQSCMGQSNHQIYKCARVLEQTNESLDGCARRRARGENSKSRLLFGSWGKSWENSAAKSIKKRISNLRILQASLSRQKIVSAMTADLFEERKQFT